MTQDRHDRPPASGLGHELDSGKGRDKNPYPDLAAAPLGTDDEAAGTPISPEQMRMARDHEIRDGTPADSDAPAVLHGRETREFDSDPTLQPHIGRGPGSPAPAGPGPARGWIAYALGAVVLVLVLWMLLGR